MANRLHEEQTDPFTGYTVAISSDHSYIHQGKGFTFAGSTPSVAAGASYVMEITTPKGVYVHLRPVSVSSVSNVGAFKIAEGTTFSGGTDITPINRNRNSTKAVRSSVKTGIAITVEGTNTLVNFSIGSGGNPTVRAGGQNGENDEWVLKPETTYSLKFSNIGATDATVFYFTIFFYEEAVG